MNLDKNAIYDITDLKNSHEWIMEFTYRFHDNTFETVWVRVGTENKRLFMMVDNSLQFFFYFEHMTMTYKNGKKIMAGHFTLNKSDKQVIQEQHADEIEKGAIIILEKFAGENTQFTFRGYEELGIVKAK